MLLFGVPGTTEQTMKGSNTKEAEEVSLSARLENPKTRTGVWRRDRVNRSKPKRHCSFETVLAKKRQPPLCRLEAGVKFEIILKSK